MGLNGHLSTVPQIQIYSLFNTEYVDVHIMFTFAQWVWPHFWPQGCDLYKLESPPLGYWHLNTYIKAVIISQQNLYCWICIITKFNLSHWAWPQFWPKGSDLYKLDLSPLQFSKSYVYIMWLFPLSRKDFCSHFDPISPWGTRTASHGPELRRFASPGVAQASCGVWSERSVKSTRMSLFSGVIEDNIFN